MNLVALDIEALRRARQAARIGGTVHYFESVDSTNSVARQLAREGAAEGAAVIAESQTKGRGRLGRNWASPPFRNLYLSVVLRPPIAINDAPCLSLVAGLAAVEAIGQWAPRAAIKWPNDIVIDGRKVSGILTEMDADGEGVHFVVVGIGVNLNSAHDDFPPELRDKAIGLCSVTGRPIDRVAFTAELMARLEERYDLFVRVGFGALRPAWDAHSCLTGQHVQIDEGGRRFDGVVSGLADDGTLRLRDATGEERRVVAGDVTLIGGYESTSQPPGLTQATRGNTGR